jgi:manganese/iron transport system permease protein
VSELLEVFEYGFMRNAIWLGVVVAAMCAVLSCYLVLKGWALMGDAVSHAVLPGIVIAYVVGLPLVFGAFVAGMLCSLGAGFVKRNSRLKEDTAMGVVFTGLFAFGVVLFSKVKSDLHLDHILVGNIMGIGKEQMRESMILGGVVILVTLVLRKDLLLVCFDAGQARVMGLREGVLNFLLLGLLALAIVVAMQVVGIILVVAMLVMPGCVSYLWTDRFDRMLVIAVFSAVLAMIVGIVVSYHADASPAGCVVLVQALMFFVSFVFAPKHGLLARR